MKPSYVPLIALAFAAVTAHAQKVYKHVDDKGNVTYSQTPPANDAKVVNVPPPRRVPSSTSHQRNEEFHALQQAEHERRRLEFERRQAEQREAQQEAKRKRDEALQAECQRNRGTDCNDPAALARMEAERGPNQYRPRAR
jgi:hypothetical protein